jgi:hypothetical protein
MCETNKPKFFQNEKKFVVGESYETLRVKMPPWGTYVSNIETCDEIGTIIPNSEKFLGKYVSSQNYGCRDSSGRYDYFTNENNETITNCLDYHGTTRYRVVSNIDKKIDSVMFLEGIEDEINNQPPPPPSIFNNANNNDALPAPPSSANNSYDAEHITKCLLELNFFKEICTYTNPSI